MYNIYTSAAKPISTAIDDVFSGVIVFCRKYKRLNARKLRAWLASSA